VNLKLPTVFRLHLLTSVSTARGGIRTNAHASAIQDIALVRVNTNVLTHTPPPVPTPRNSTSILALAIVWKGSVRTRKGNVLTPAHGPQPSTLKPVLAGAPKDSVWTRQLTPVLTQTPVPTPWNVTSILALAIVRKGSVWTTQVANVLANGPVIGRKNWTKRLVLV
jgi:hypothetical protein